MSGRDDGLTLWRNSGLLTPLTPPTRGWHQWLGRAHQPWPVSGAAYNGQPAQSPATSPDRPAQDNSKTRAARPLHDTIPFLPRSWVHKPQPGSRKQTNAERERLRPAFHSITPGPALLAGDEMR